MPEDTSRIIIMELVFFMIFVAIPYEYIGNFLEVFSSAIFYKNVDDEPSV